MNKIYDYNQIKFLMTKCSTTDNDVIYQKALTKKEIAIYVANRALNTEK